MVEIRPTRRSGLSKPDRPGLVQPGHQEIGYIRPLDRISIPFLLFTPFLAIHYVQIKLFLTKLIASIDYTVEFQESWGGDSASLRLGAAKIDP